MKLSTIFRGQEVLAKLLVQIVLTIKERSRTGELVWPNAPAFLARVLPGVEPQVSTNLQLPQVLVAHLRASRLGDVRWAQLPAELRSYVCFNTSPSSACYMLCARSNVHQGEAHPFGHMPLQVLKMEGLVAYCSRVQRGLPQLPSQLPFALEKHPAAQSDLACAMLRRLREDVSQYAQQQNSLLLPQLAGLSEGELTRSLQSTSCLAKLRCQAQSFVQVLSEQWRRDLQRFDALVALSLKCANNTNDAPRAVPSAFCTDSDSGAAQAEQETAQRAAQLRSFSLARAGGAESELSFAQLVPLIAMSDAIPLLMVINPFLPAKRAEEALDATALAMLTANRVSQVLECLNDARELQAYLEQLVALGDSRSIVITDMASGGEGSAVLERAASSKAGVLASRLTARRHYMVERPPRDESGTAGGAYSLDPRLLVFEFRHDLLLREVQVALLKRFAEAHAQGRSLCHQLIMGQGKTTIITPLLSIKFTETSHLCTI